MDSQATIRLDGELTTYRAADLKPLLLPLQREAAALERPLQWLRRSRGVDEALALLDDEVTTGQVQRIVTLAIIDGFQVGQRNAATDTATA